MVYTALQTTDYEFARRSLLDAQQKCASASAKLKTTPGFPNADKASEGVDKMASAFGQMADAMSKLDSSPRKARREAREGMNLYKRGLELVTEAGK